MSEVSDFEDEEGVDGPNLNEEDERGNDDENEEVPDNPLTKETVGLCLSLLCKIGNGLAHAYVRLDVHGRGLTDISLLNCYIHLRYIDVSQNRLTDISALNSLTHLITIKTDKNLLKSGKLDELPYLQTASFARNKIVETEGFNHPLLESLNLNSNQIADVKSMDPKKLSRLQILELRENKLVSTQGLTMPNLTRLYVGFNDIRTLEDLTVLEHLTTLHLRKNRIEKLDGFADTLKNLQYINLRENLVSQLSELNKLTCLPRLRALVLYENPVASSTNYRIEVLICLRRLERLDKDHYTEDERQEAEEVQEQRKQEEEARGAGDMEVIHSDEDNH